MVAKNLMDFTQHYQDAVDAVLNAIAAIGEERRQHLRDAKLAVDRAMMPAAVSNGIWPTTCAGRSRTWRFPFPQAKPRSTDELV
jgi:hypothetical protein